MRHRRNYADVPDAVLGKGMPPGDGFLGVPRVGPDVSMIVVLGLVLFAGYKIASGLKPILWSSG